jgi:ParB family chromosome partitioning protein
VAVSNLIRLLDLPDEALELIESGELTEGHGRALLLAADHADRRKLAKDAVAGRWSVRELESRARAADGGSTQRAASRARRRAIHPDQAAAMEQIADALGEVLGADIDVAPAGRGYRAHITFESLDEALDMARRLRVRAAA